MIEKPSKHILFRHFRTFYHGGIPSQLIIQLTDSCNASCPQCGMRRNALFRRSLLPLDDGRRIIDHAASFGISAISFTGGEPLLFPKELFTLIDHAGNAGIPYIRTGTNGFTFMNSDGPDFVPRISRLAETMAASRLYTFWISIDSPSPQVHETMRGLPGVIKGIERALPILHDYGIFPSANLGVTKAILSSGSSGSSALEEAFRKGFRRFFHRVTEMGFTIANVCYPMSLDPAAASSLDAVYGATSENDLVRFTIEEKRVMFRALRKTIPEFRGRIRIFSPLSSLYALERQYSGDPEYPRHCRGGSDFFFIDSEGGNTYPCGYRGADNLGKFWDLNPDSPPFTPSCRQCDWECFRDPSEMLAPFSEVFSAPFRLLARLIRNRAQTSLWLDDLRYYRAADFFNGRRPPDFRKLERFSTGAHPTPEATDNSESLKADS